MNFNFILDSAPLWYFALYSELTYNMQLWEWTDWHWLQVFVVDLTDYTKAEDNLSDQNFDAIVFPFCTAVLLSLSFVNVFLSPRRFWFPVGEYLTSHINDFHKNPN